MEREASATGAIARGLPGRGEGLAIRSGELIAVMAGVLALTILLWNRNRVTGWEPAAVVFGTIAIAPLVLRTLQARFSTNRFLRFVADFGPVGYIVGFYLFLNPILDAVNVPIADDLLIRADQRIFGVQPSIWLAARVPPFLNDVFLAAYTTYFLWPAALGLVLWLQRKDIQFDEWATALMFFYAVNFALYAAVPAMGPRYYQAAFFDGPVHGWFLAPHIDVMFRGSPLARDCFPSGHTGISLLVLAYSWREARRFFWFALPVLICLIVGTLAGRFHYGVDLLAAVPLTATSLLVAAKMKQRLPTGMALSRIALLAVRRDRPGI